MILLLPELLLLPEPMYQNKRKRWVKRWVKTSIPEDVLNDYIPDAQKILQSQKVLHLAHL
jgi:hypothetical protein